VVRRAALKLSLLGALVLVGHLLALEWLGREADGISGMPQMAPAMYTRLLKPQAPAPVVAAVDSLPPRPRARIAPRSKPPASAPSEAKAAEPQPEAEAVRKAEADAQAAPKAEPETAPVAAEPPVAEAPTPAASGPVASAPVPPASAPTGVATREVGSLDDWPTDTRLSYVLSGEWRGPLFGDARVQWQRDGDKYQVRLDVRIQVFGTQVFTSQGEVTPQGLVPRAYEEMRPGKRRAAQFGDEVLMLENGRTAKRPPGVQDTASQFVELTHRFATGKEVLEVGRTVSVWLARPGAVDLWTYDIVARETLRTPRLGDVEAFHLKPRPIANPRGNITAEMWFAPTLQYLPVRIRVSMGNEAYLDLLVEQIEQR
jgi:hypothetical protein